MLIVIVSLVMHYYVITSHMITEMNNDECHVPEKAVNMHRV